MKRREFEINKGLPTSNDSVKLIIKKLLSEETAIMELLNMG
jgi:hypothetical protein